MSQLESRIGDNIISPSEEYLIIQAQKYRTRPIRRHFGENPFQPYTEAFEPLEPASGLNNKILGESKPSVKPTYIKPLGLNHYAKSTFWALASILLTNFLGAFATVYFGHRALRSIKNNGGSGKGGVLVCLGIAYIFLFPFVGLAVEWLLKK